MSPAQEMHQTVSFAEKVCGKYANIKAISVAVSKPCLVQDWLARGKLSQSNGVHRLESLGICASKKWL